MKTLAIFSLGLAVALGMPPFAPDVAQNPVLTGEEQRPLLGDLVPVEGHVVVEDPAPQIRLGSREQQEKLAPETDQSLLHVQAKKSSMMELEAEVKPEVKMEPVVKEGMEELEVKVKPDDKVDPELNAEQEVKMERDVKVDPEAKADTEVHLNPEVMAEQEVEVKSEVKMESELDVGPDLKVESEVKVDFQWEPEVKPMFNNEQEVQEEFQVKEETETSLEVEERHIDMEGKYEMMGEPIKELEPLDDDSMFGEELSNTELSEVEKSMRAAFQSQDPDADRLPEEEGIMGRSNHVLDGEPIMELEPETKEEQQGVKNPVERSLLPKATGQCSCPGVVLERKCYQFFKGPKRADDAEFFCQEHFPSGHLASITSQYIHREVMNMMLRQNGAYTRTWIGGLRYLKTGRFIWLDGSHWGYADWLSGEPNNTADVEDCLEVLAFGNGKFNDFTCWEPQAFICSYPY